MEKKRIRLPECHAFIACSMDGYIATLEGDIDWLTNLPTLGLDFGYAAFLAKRDAILMGRGSFEKVIGFDPWPYSLPVTVLSQTLRPPTPSDLPVQISNAGLRETLFALYAAGNRSVYVDGGKVISSLLRDGFLTQMIVTRVPVLLGSGLPLFSQTGAMTVKVQSVQHWPNGFVQTTFTP